MLCALPAVMPTYYFNLRGEDFELPDLAGKSLSDDAAARAEAERLAAELVESGPDLGHVAARRGGRGRRRADAAAAGLAAQPGGGLSPCSPIPVRLVPTKERRGPRRLSRRAAGGGGRPRRGGRALPGQVRPRNVPRPHGSPMASCRPGAVRHLRRSDGDDGQVHPGPRGDRAEAAQAVSGRRSRSLRCFSSGRALSPPTVARAGQPMSIFGGVVAGRLGPADADRDSRRGEEAAGRADRPGDGERHPPAVDPGDRPGGVDDEEQAAVLVEPAGRVGAKLRPEVRLLEDAEPRRPGSISSLVRSASFSSRFSSSSTLLARGRSSSSAPPQAAREGARRRRRRDMPAQPGTGPLDPPPPASGESRSRRPDFAQDRSGSRVDPG